MIRNFLILILLAAPLVAQEDADYQKGLAALDSRQWDQAIAAFDVSAGHKSSNADGALYWKAYALNRAGRRDEALGAISALRRDYAASRWNRDARALELEIRGQSGERVSPAREPDEELKILALNSLMQSDPNQAVPILQKLLTSNNSPKVKEKALFVLTQSRSAEASKVLNAVARDTSNPDLQLKAIRYMGMMGSPEARKELAVIYNASSDDHLKRAILRSFMQSGSRDFLLNAAKGEKNPDLRKEAIRQLAMTGGQEELWQLYQSSSAEAKEEILKSMFLGGNSSRLAEVARTEKDPRLQIAAIKSLGLMGGKGSGDVLVSIYQSNSNRDVREAVLQALFLQQNGKAMVDLARAEKDPAMKSEIVKKMSLIHDKDVTDYMLEILK
jgi:HEAT repeat protein